MEHQTSTRTAAHDTPSQTKKRKRSTWPQAGCRSLPGAHGGCSTRCCTRNGVLMVCALRARPHCGDVPEPCPPAGSRSSHAAPAQKLQMAEDSKMLAVKHGEGGNRSADGKQGPGAEAPAPPWSRLTTSHAAAAMTNMSARRGARTRPVRVTSSRRASRMRACSPGRRARRTCRPSRRWPARICRAGFSRRAAGRRSACRRPPTC